MRRDPGCHGAILLCALLLLLPAVPAVAGGPVLVVPDTTDEAAAEAARGKVQLLTGVVIPPERTRGLDDLVAETGYGSLTEGGATVFTCKGPALDGPGFDARLAAAVRLVDDLDLDAASAAFDGLQADLPCSIAAIPARQLHDVFFFSGLMAAYRKDRDRAIDQFARAAALKPDVAWNESYDPSAQQLFLLGKEQALTAEPVQLTVVPPVDARRVWLDGRVSGESGPMSAEVRAGTHLVHVETTGGALRAVGLDLRPGPCLWADPRAAASAIESGEMDGPAGLGAAALLARGAATWDADAVYSVGARGVLRYTAEGGIERPQRPLTPSGDRVALRAGGGVLVREAPYRKPFVYAAPSLELDVGIVRGLQLSAFLQLGLASFATDSLSLLPTWGVGAQWAFSGVTVRPFAGAQAAFIARQVTAADGSRRAGVGVGALARLGLILAPRPRAPFRLGIAASFGWVEAVHAGITVTVGAGLTPSG